MLWGKYIWNIAQCFSLLSSPMESFHEKVNGWVSVIYLFCFCLFLSDRGNRECFWYRWRITVYYIIVHRYSPTSSYSLWLGYTALPHSHCIWLCDLVWPDSRWKVLQSLGSYRFDISTSLKWVHMVGLDLLHVCHGNEKNVAWIVHWTSEDEKQGKLVWIQTSA